MKQPSGGAVPVHRWTASPTESSHTPTHHSKVRAGGGRATLDNAAQPVDANPLKRLFKTLGPGLITGASDDDPSGIGTYAVAGASLGYSTLWTALVTYPMMAAVQFTCAKIGMVNGVGLAGVLRQRYPATG